MTNKKSLYLTKTFSLSDFKDDEKYDKSAEFKNNNDGNDADNDELNDLKKEKNHVYFKMRCTNKLL